MRTPFLFWAPRSALFIGSAISASGQVVHAEPPQATVPDSALYHLWNPRGTEELTCSCIRNTTSDEMTCTGCVALPPIQGQKVRSQPLPNGENAKLWGHFVQNLNTDGMLRVLVDFVQLEPQHSEVALGSSDWWLHFSATFSCTGSAIGAPLKILVTPRYGIPDRGANQWVRDEVQKVCMGTAGAFPQPLPPQSENPPARVAPPRVATRDVPLFSRGVNLIAEEGAQGKWRIRLSPPRPNNQAWIAIISELLGDEEIKRLTTEIVIDPEMPQNGFSEAVIACKIGQTQKVPVPTILGPGSFRRYLKKRIVERCGNPNPLD